jgi:ligand-binding sensor domain-containing protein
LLWLAAANGLYRFDGFHYHRIVGFPFSSAQFVGFTRDGSLWASGVEGLARLSGERFQIVLNERVHQMVTYSDGVFLRLKQLARVSLDGSITALASLPARDVYIDADGHVQFVCLKTRMACSLDPQRPDELQRTPLPAQFDSVMVLRDGAVWAAADRTAMLLDGGRSVLRFDRRDSYEARRAGPLRPGRGGQLWFIGETIRGLVSPLEFEERQTVAHFSPTAGVEDSHGRLWVAALGRGLVEWVVDSGWRRWFPEHFGNADAVQVVRDAKGAVVVASHDNLYRQERSGWRALRSAGRRFAAVLPLQDGGFLASLRESGLVRLSARGDLVESIPDPTGMPDAYREIVRDGKGRLWVGHKRELLRVEGQPGELRLKREALPEVDEGMAQAVDLEVDASGRLWAGYGEGIAVLEDDGRWQRITTSRPLTLIRSFALAPTAFWVAYRQAGAFSQVVQSRQAWMVTAMGTNAGYTPPDTHFIKRDSRGWIWRGSPEGVHISDGSRVEPDDWINIGLSNGLATDQTDQYGFFEDSDGAVWIAGAEGVSRLQPNEAWFQAPLSVPPPRVTRLEADGREFQFPSAIPNELPAGTTNVRLDFGGLHAPWFRKRPLRYRLLPVAPEWQFSKDGTVKFAELRGQSYAFEAAYAGTGPAEVSSFAFRIGAPPAQISWLWLIGMALGAGTLFPVIRFVPWFDKPKFRLQKALFLLRRRYGRRARESSSGGALAAPDRSGETLEGRYLLSRIISHGGFSSVYEARDLAHGSQRVAVKVLYGQEDAEDKTRDRFAYEVAALRSVDHPCVVRILNSWIGPDGEPCLAMPFLDGETLRAALNAGPFRRDRVARIVRDLGAALSEVHACGIVHRDLKPENIILLEPGTARERPVIVDFGTAGLRNGGRRLAATTLMAGSFHYMAPERLTGHYSAATDVFSLAVMVLEMLTGKRLGDLNVMVSDAAFESELEKTLRARNGKILAASLTALLSPGFHAEPSRRPSPVAEWTERIAAALDHV